MFYSIVNCSISMVIWSHYRTLMTFIGFLGLIALHLGAIVNGKNLSLILLKMHFTPAMLTFTVIFLMPKR
ncbi:hypothetical protein THRCLA_23418 [Thraustotheca clavata]|uniref:Uncharacterized protein n=1 Tax=Thraustotheca clavata TaxID=74557 RepID=A0A1V9Y5T9_9STRA|nr:hypothetical protein THRCLA_23418 [Thraustotheca clavata]